MTAVQTIIDPLSVLNTREKRLDRYSYKLSGMNQYGLDTTYSDEAEVNEREMSFLLPFASGKRRDGVGDLLEVGGIRTERHRLNPIILLDHGKHTALPIGLAEDRETKAYTVVIDPVKQEATAKVFVYQTGEGRTNDHALFCEQIFDLWAKRLIRGGSIGYQVVKALNLQPDYETGTPQGLHLLVTLMLEASAVVLPANQDTTAQDTAVKILAMPRVCGKRLSPYLVKSLECYCPEQTKTVVGFDGIKSIRAKYKEQVAVPLRSVQGGKIPPAKWKPGAGAIKSAQSAYRVMDFVEGETVVAKKIIMKGGPLVPGGMYIFAQPGDRLTVVRGGKTSAKVRNAVGKEGECSGNEIRKLKDSHHAKSIKELRKRYKTAKGSLRRLRKSTPGRAIVHIDRKDIDNVEEEATKRGLKFQRLAPHTSGSERIKLMGDDSSIDEVAKQYGRPMRIKDMASKVKTKAMDAADQVENADEAVELNEGENVKGMDDGYGEPFGSQVLRRLHEDHSILMKEYDGMMSALDHEHVKNHLTGHLQNMEKFLTDTENLHSKHYKDLPGLNGEKANPEGETEEEFAEEEEEMSDQTEKDLDTEETEAVEATSGEEEVPSPEEALEGMEDEDEGLGQKYLKVDQKTRGKYKQKSVKCAKCGKGGCSCGKSLKKKKKDFDTVDAADEKVELNEPGEKELEPHEQQTVDDAKSYLKELSEEQNFGDEHRMKSYHFHKALDNISDGHDADSQMDEMGGMKRIKSEPGSPEWEQEEMQEPEHKSMRKCCKDASGFFKELSQERAFGDAHREKALHFHKSLSPMDAAEEDSEVQEGGEMVGEMGEKAISAAAKKQAEIIADLDKKMRWLAGKVG